MAAGSDYSDFEMDAPSATLWEALGYDEVLLASMSPDDLEDGLLFDLLGQGSRKKSVSGGGLFEFSSL